MAEIVRVVARFLDGSVLKGTTQDFLPNRPSFHLIPAGGGPVAEVRCDRLKAVFFVKSLEGDSGRDSVRGFLEAPAATAQGRKIAVLFRDGELMCGYTLAYQPGRDGFFLSPVDAEGNNIRAYVLVAAAREVKAGPAAEALAAQVLSRAGG